MNDGSSRGAAGRRVDALVDVGQISRYRKQRVSWSLTMPVACMNASQTVGPTKRKTVGLLVSLHDPSTRRRREHRKNPNAEGLAVWVDILLGTAAGSRSPGRNRS
jgi:hypothetical protein